MDALPRRSPEGSAPAVADERDRPADGVLLLDHTEGEITDTGREPPDPPELPTGEVLQRPPLYSAVKVSGQRAYARARRGESFQTPERRVTVYRFEQLWREQRRAAVARRRAAFLI